MANVLYPVALSAEEAYDLITYLGDKTDVPDVVYVVYRTLRTALLADERLSPGDYPPYVSGGLLASPEPVPARDDDPNYCPDCGGPCEFDSWERDDDDPCLFDSEYDDRLAE